MNQKDYKAIAEKFYNELKEWDKDNDIHANVHSALFSVCYKLADYFKRENQKKGLGFEKDIFLKDCGIGVEE